MVPNLWVTTPSGAIYQVSYIMIHNSSRITVIKQQQNNFTIGVTTIEELLNGHSIRKLRTTALEENVGVFLLFFLESVIVLIIQKKIRTYFKMKSNELAIVLYDLE